VATPVIPDEAIPKNPPNIKEVTFGGQVVVVHEINVLQEIYGRKLFMVAYHITDNTRRDAQGQPLKTPVAHLFVAEPEITPEEKRGKTLADIAKLWQDKLTEAVKSELEKAVKIYRANVSVFMR
jgi:hypothetical protein